MNGKDRRKIQKAFLRKAGPNAETFKNMMELAPGIAFYMKDAEGRIMAMNKQNRDNCNIRDEMDVIGLRSDALFPSILAKSYMELDKTVMRMGKPLVNYPTHHNADRSIDSHVKNLFPLRDGRGRIIGTTCIYYTKPSVADAPDWHGRMRSVTEWIAEHYAEHISLSQLAEMVGTSEPNFRRQFSHVFGISPGRYLTTIRLNAARKLLETTDKLVSEIAVETGFWDQSHLTKLFKRERGITPGEYRRKHRQV
ncbi:MAG: helix-turn-helix domain-containing protein [Victivallales bacterium]|nr:helix-turn-helix domain-containing protein [Victivallales bacterium]